MKRIFKLCVSLCLLFFIFALFNCNRTPYNPAPETAPVKLMISTANAPSEVSSITGELSRSGFETVTSEFVISNDSATANFGEIAVGTWHLVVTAYSSSMDPLYQGETDVTISGGVTNIVHLTLEPTTGSLQVVVTWSNGNLATNGDFIYMYTPSGSYPGSDIYRYSLESGNFIQITHGLQAAYPSKISETQIGFKRGNSNQYVLSDPAGNNQNVAFDLPVSHFDRAKYNQATNRIFFYTYSYSHPRDLAVIDLSGDNFTYLTEDNFQNYGPFPNESGDSLIYSSNRNGIQNIFLLDLTTHNTTQLTFYEEYKVATEPQWSKYSNGYYYILREESPHHTMVLYHNFGSATIDTVFNPSDLYFVNFSLSPDESKIAVDGCPVNDIGEYRNLYIYDREMEELNQKTFTNLSLQVPRWFHFE